MSLENNVRKDIAGQAVINGVMFRDKNNIVVAVRTKQGIKVKTERFRSITQNKICGLPFIRGFFVLIETLIVAVKSLSFSGSAEEDIKLGMFEILLSLIFAFALALLIFKFIPLAIVQLLNLQNNITFNLIEGLLKIVMITLYIFLIGLMKDIKVTFEYHGAEHKVVNCYEQGKKITMKNVKQCKKEHARCGTAFILIVIFLSIIVYMFLPLDLPLLEKYMYRLLLLPLIAMISYEMMKLSSKYDIKFLLAPGIVLQKLTTKEPNDRQIRVSIAAMNTLLQQNKKLYKEKW